jgi:hypothetical protein
MGEQERFHASPTQFSHEFILAKSVIHRVSVAGKFVPVAVCPARTQNTIAPLADRVSTGVCGRTAKTRPRPGQGLEAD